MFEPRGRGIDDFADPKNDEGCLAQRERISAWYYFEFRADMPPNSVIEFTIKALGGGNTDYDFALFGPDLDCDSLGSPIRCSFADPNNVALGGDTTGLRPFVFRKNPFGQIIEIIPQTETSEGRLTDPLGRAADGFVAPLVVQPRQGFYLLLDFFQRDFNDSTDFLQFQLTWGGSAAPFLNCIANPRCKDAFTEAGPNLELCAGPQQIQLQGAAFNTNGGETYRWTATGNAAAFIANPRSPQTQVNLPASFSGDITFRLTVDEGKCIKEDSFRLRVFPLPNPRISGDTVLCPGNGGNLTAQPGFVQYRWRDGPTTAGRPIPGPGVYQVEVTDLNGCTGVRDITVRNYVPPIPIINGPPGFCQGLQATLSVGPEYSNVRWSTGSGNSSIVVDRPGRYRVEVTSPEGCPASDSIDIQEFTNPQPVINGPPVICENTTATLSAGNYPFFLWSTGETSPAIQVDREGAYSVTVTDQNGCGGQGLITMRSGLNPTASISGDSLFCSNASTQLRANGTFPRYAWSTGETTQTISVNQPGIYSLTVTDSQGCSGTAQLGLDTLAVPLPRIMGPVELCSGDSIRLDGGTGFSAYRWSTGSTAPSISLSSGGLYGLTVTAANGCTGNDSVQVQLNISPSPRINGPASFCEGNSATLDAGPGFVAYQWSTGAVSPSIPVAAPGAYQLTVTDAEGCTGTASFNIRESLNPRPGITAPSAFCSGEDALLEADAGFPTYRWSTGATEAAIRVRTPGTYQVTVTDSLGCSGQTQINIDTLRAPRPSIIGPASVCSNDSISLAADSVYLRYNWSTGAQSPGIQIKTGGEYRLSVTAANGCTGVDSVSIIGFTAPSLQISGPLSFCDGNSAILRGSPGFVSYSWENGETATERQVSNPGTYRLTVTDGNGCSGAASFSIVSTPNPQPRIIAPARFCSGAEARMEAETGFQTYRWSTGDSTLFIDINQPGTYQLLVTDSLGCSGQVSAAIDTLPAPRPVIVGPDRVCSNDSIRLTADASYTAYRWSTGSDQSSIVVRNGGDYRLSVTAANGCTGIDSSIIRRFVAPTPVITAPPYFCEGNTAVIRAEEGFVRYQWATGETQREITTTQAGRFLVSVLDSNGCSGQASLFVPMAPRPTVAINGRPNFCSGDSTQLSSAGRFSSYRWSTGEQEPQIIVGDAGVYTLTATDSLGCAAEARFQVDTLPRPRPIIGGPRFICLGDTIFLDAGADYAQYRWSNGGTQRSIRVLAGGAFSLTVTNEFGCQAEQSATVQPFLRRQPALNPVEEFCSGDSLVLRPGGGFVSYRWSDQSTGSTLTVKRGGNYALTVTDENGCQARASVRVVENTIVEPNIRGPEEFCSGQRVSLFAEGPYLSYRWSTQEIAPNISISRGGVYSVSVTDANGCTALRSKTVLEKPSPIIGIQGDTLYCAGDSTILRVDEGYASYTWTNGGLTPSITVSRPGLYGVMVRADNGCAVSDQVAVLEAPAPVPQLLPNVLFCSNDQVQLDAGPGFSSYRWSNDSTNRFLNVRLGGIFRVTVTDSRGCPGSAQTIVRQLPPPRPQVESQKSFCAGTTAILRADSTFRGFRWSTGDTTLSIAVSRPGVYQVTLTDRDGCNAERSIQLSEIAPPVFEIRGQRYVCEGERINLAVETLFSRYRWSTGSTRRNIEVSEAGTYSVTVTSQEGCQAVRTAEIQLIPRPIADAGPPALIDCRSPLIQIGGPNTTQGRQFDYRWRGPGIDNTNSRQASPIVGRGGEYILQVSDRDFGCLSAPDTVEVEDLRISPLAQVQVTDTLDCLTDTVVLDASASVRETAYRYIWRDGEGRVLNTTDNFRLPVSFPGLYSLSIEDPATGCTGIARALVLANRLRPRVEAGPNRQLDCRQERVALDATGSSFGPQFQLNWSTRDGRIAAEANSLGPIVDQPGIYTLRVVDQNNGCEQLDSVRVVRNVVLPLADAGSDQLLDCDMEEVLLDASASSRGAGFNYNWSLSGDPGFSASGLRSAVSRPGLYRLEVENTQNGCTAFDSVVVTRNENLPVAVDINTRPATCFGDADGSIRFGNVSGGEGPYLFSINDRPFSSIDSIGGLKAGEYQVRVQDSRGCELALPVQVADGNDLRVNLGEDFSIRLGDSVIIQALVNVSPDAIKNFRWEQPQALKGLSSMIAKVSPTEQTTYRAIAVDTNNCTDDDFLVITVKKDAGVFIPNAFSPNNDGDNDLFLIFSGKEVVKINYLRLFTRWGEMVYQQRDFFPNDPAYGWNGKHDGKFLNPQVLVYVAEIVFIDGREEVFKGSVNLIR